MFDLTHKVAIVTGSASGIGRTTAETLAAQGAAVVIADIMGEAAVETAADIRRSGGRAIGLRVDVAVEEDIAGMIGAAVDEFGGIDVLHSNAAAVQSEVLTQDTNIVDLDAELFMVVLRTNVVGCALGAKHAIPHMIERGGGVIINTASAGGQSAQTTRPMYGTSKAAVIQLTRHIATMHGKQNIRCVSVRPASQSRRRSPASFARVDRAERAAQPDAAGRPSRGHRRARRLSRLGRRAFITGIDIRVDGGMLAHFPAFAEDLTAGQIGAGTRL